MHRVPAVQIYEDQPAASAHHAPRKFRFPIADRKGSSITNAGVRTAKPDHLTDRIDYLFSAPEARLDRWRHLLKAAQACSTGKGTVQASCAEHFEALVPYEEQVQSQLLGQKSSSEAWLAKHRAALGKRSTVDLQSLLQGSVWEAN